MQHSAKAHAFKRIQIHKNKMHEMGIIVGCIDCILGFVFYKFFKKMHENVSKIKFSLACVLHCIGKSTKI